MVVGSVRVQCSLAAQAVSGRHALAGRLATPVRIDNSATVSRSKRRVYQSHPRCVAAPDNYQLLGDGETWAAR
jgi:hypothetical protein